MMNAFDISTSGLVAQRQRMNTIAGNLANLNTTRNEKGELSPFQRRLIRFQAAEPASEQSQGMGVKYRVELDTSSEPRRVHDPTHPDADKDGNVFYPNINLITEFVNAMEASRAYQANLAAFDITKEMTTSSLKILA